MHTYLRWKGQKKMLILVANFFFAYAVVPGHGARNLPGDGAWRIGPEEDAGI